jgi:hypothetical protein
MILTLIRNRTVEIIDGEIYCIDDDFETALAIIKSTIDHSILVSNLLGNATNVQKLNMREVLLLSRLNKDFSRKQVLEIGADMGIPRRSLDFILKKLIRLEIVTKISNGVFQKK